MYSLLANTVVVISLLAILLSLGCGLFYLLHNQSNGNQVYKALVVRISLSILLFVGIICAIFFGLVMPAPPPL